MTSFTMGGRTEEGTSHACAPMHVGGGDGATFISGASEQYPDTTGKGIHSGVNGIPYC